ncbi:MAG: SGNH/GDSL hydrolase family protein [Clostridiaceae bacterium]|nr:SGNH/GDSL hydrolase family protein [Clostridiaceae bacterium]
MSEEQLFIFGDSILRGVIWDEAARRYRFSKTLDLSEACAPIKVTNRSKFGCTIDRGISMVMDALKRNEPMKYAIVEFGGNDCDFDWTRVSEEPDIPHIPNTELSRFKLLYQDAVRALMDRGIKPILMTLPPLDASRYLSWITKNGLSRDRILQFLGDTQRIYRFQELYSNAVASVAIKMNCAIVDVRSAFLSSWDFSKLMCIDGIHPNAEGQKVIINEFRKVFA